MNLISTPILWSIIFRKKVREEGETLFRSGSAKHAVTTDQGYSVRVRTDRNYTVDVDTDFGETQEGATLEYITGLHCSCDQAKKGKLCVHMAAGLFRIEEDYGGLYADAAQYPEEEKSKAVKTVKKAAKTVKKAVAPEVASASEELEKEAKKPPLRTDADLVLPELAKLQKQDETLRKEEAAESGDTNTFQPEEYRYFQPEKFWKDYYVGKKAREEAEELLESGSVFMMDFFTGTENRIGSDKVMGQAEYRIIESRYDVSHVTFIFDRTQIVYESCDGWECRYGSASTYKGKKKLCKHETAALMDLEKYLDTHTRLDSTTPLAARFLDRMQKKNGTEIQKTSDIKGDLLDLEPTLKDDTYGTFTCSFRVGSGKLYKIKNLNEFYQTMKKQGTMKFGKKTVLQLGEAYLSEKARPWYAFLKNVLEDERIRYNLYRRSDSYDPSTTSSDSLILYGERLDQFLELAEDGMVIPFRIQYEREKYNLHVQGKDFRPSLTIEPVMEETENTLNGVRVKGELPGIYRGIRSACYVDPADGYLNRMSRENVEQLQPLLSAREPGGSINLIVGRNHLAEFYHKVLPELKKIADVKETDAGGIEPFLPPEPDITVYLDAETESLIARAQAVYGRQTCSLLDLVNRRESDPPLEAFRDIPEEGRVVSKLMEYLPHYDPSLQIVFSQKEEDNVFDFLDHGLQELSELCEVRVTDRFRRLGLRRHVRLDVGVSLQSNLLDLSITSDDVSPEELLDILYQYQQKRRYVRLKNGDFLKLEDNESFAQVVQMMDDLHLSVKEVTKGKMHLPAYRALYLDKMLEGQADLYVDRDHHFRQLVKEFKTVEDADFEVPENLKGIIRLYQKEGYRWLRTLDQYGFCGILADEMGLGKTLQVLAVLEAVHNEEEERTVSLVVCPASLVYNWIEEAGKFAPSLKTVAVTGTASQRAKIIQDAGNADLLVTSYDLLKRDIAEYEEIEFRFEIIDEAQYIKNFRTAAAKSVKLIHAKTKYALTGTPIENRLSELWSIFDYLMPGFLFGYEDFRENFETPIVRQQDADTMEQLRRMIGPFILRRVKKDVLKDLPDKIEEIQYAGMESKQRKLYDAQVVKMKTKLRSQDDSDFRRNKIQILAELMRIRQICCDPDLCFQDYKGGSAKRELCLDLIRSLIDGGHKTLLFSQFTSMLEILQEEFDKEGISYYVITGQTPKEKRLELVKSFNEDDTPVFLISLKAGGTGLNLTGADTVIHYDPWWNTAAEDQATDRAHRIGQKHVVTVYKLVAKDTIEERIIELQKQKAQLAEDILSGESVGSSTFTKDDLLQILS